MEYICIIGMKVSLDYEYVSTLLKKGFSELFLIFFRRMKQGLPLSTPPSLYKL